MIALISTYREQNPSHYHYSSSQLRDLPMKRNTNSSLFRTGGKSIYDEPGENGNYPLSGGMPESSVCN
jgi:hypothetical protein